MVLLLILLMLAPSSVFAAISCGSAIASNDVTPASATETIAYTTPGGSNQVLFVGVVGRSTTQTINSVTHAGNAMTAVAAQSFTSPLAVRMFYLPNPTSGTNNVVVTFSGTPLADAVTIFTCSGVNTIGPIRAFNTATGSGAAISVTVSGALSSDVLVDIMGHNLPTGAPTVGANQTVLVSGTDGGEVDWGSSFQSGSDGGVMSWTAANSSPWGIHAVALVPITTNSGAVRRRN